MSKIKLYTEEQVRDMLKVCRDYDLYEDILTFDDILRTQTPIELPSDEEIGKEVSPLETMFDVGFIDGAKWVIEHIKQQDNGK